MNYSLVLYSADAADEAVLSEVQNFPISNEVCLQMCNLFLATSVIRNPFFMCARQRI